MSAKSGNPELVQRGAQWLPDDLTSLAILLNGPQSLKTKEARSDLPLLAHDAERPLAPEQGQGTTKSPRPDADTTETQPQLVPPAVPADVASQHHTEADFYSLFLIRMCNITVAAPMTANDIAARLELEKAQANAWLKRGVVEGKIKKLSKPVRYQSAVDAHQQALLFGDDR
jgi:predicted Rossmann fold nucleotide-binding protein DprA/Smf involved in DNA uptake